MSLVFVVCLARLDLGCAAVACGNGDSLVAVVYYFAAVFNDNDTRTGDNTSCVNDQRTVFFDRYGSVVVQGSFVSCRDPSRDNEVGISVNLICGVFFDYDILRENNYFLIYWNVLIEPALVFYAGV